MRFFFFLIFFFKKKDNYFFIIIIETRRSILVQSGDVEGIEKSRTRMAKHNAASRWAEEAMAVEC